MKELIKPNSIEKGYLALNEFAIVEECGRYCRGCATDGPVCNRHCSEGTNTSPADENDILF